MVANLIPKSDGYRCSNCMMKFSRIVAHCPFCNEIFANWEELAYKEVMQQIAEETRSQFANVEDIKVGDKI